MATLGTNIIGPALRKAGIKRLPGNTSSTDQNTEMIQAVNRILDHLNIQGHMIFGTTVQQFPLVPNQISYTIGSGGDFNTARPNCIKNANLVQPTTPPIYQSITIYDSRDWSYERVVSLPGSWIYALWYNALAVEFAGPCGRIYLLGQPPAGYELQLFTWNEMKSNFSAMADAFVFPPGYEAALVNLAAIECADLYPLEATMSAEAKRRCMASVQAIKILNATLPRMTNDAARLGGSTGTVLPASFWNSYGPGL